MNLRQLGRTGLRVSELCLGAMTFGREADEGHFYVGEPLEMEGTHVALDLRRLVERSAGVFGKMPAINVHESRRRVLNLDEGTFQPRPSFCMVAGSRQMLTIKRVTKLGPHSSSR